MQAATTPGAASDPSALPSAGSDRGALTEALDAARSAVRAGAKQITIMSLESREEMPAHDFEVEEAEHEGIGFLPRRGPARIVVDDGRVTGLETVGVVSVFDEDGGFAPVFDEQDRQVLAADTIILAIGQAIDLDSLGSNGPDISPRRTIGIDFETGATSMADVWSGGDAAKGPRTLIDAIADGRRSATDIHRSFGGDVVDDQPGRMVELKQFHRLEDNYDRQGRVEVPTLETNRRVGLAEVEIGFTPEQARCEANRCLRCFANILLDVDKCVLCALCADVCPVDVISLVPAEEITTPEIEQGDWAGAVEAGVGDVDLGEATALLLDETACIRCGLCIERCPPKALSMGMWSGVGVPEWQ